MGSFYSDGILGDGILGDGILGDGILGDGIVADWDVFAGLQRSCQSVTNWIKLNTPSINSKIAKGAGARGGGNGRRQWTSRRAREKRISRNCPPCIRGIATAPFLGIEGEGEAPHSGNRDAAPRAHEPSADWLIHPSIHTRIYIYLSMDVSLF